MAFSALLRPNLPASSSLRRSKCCTLFLITRQKRSELITIPKRKNHHSGIVKSVLHNGKSSVSDNGATEPARNLLERLFTQSLKLEELGKDSPEGAQLGFDLVAAVTALKKKEQDLQDAERQLLLEHTQLNRAKQELSFREREIAAACSKHEKLEDELKLANFKVASQAAYIEELKLQIKQKDDDISAAESTLAFKEDELDEMRSELKKRSEKAANAEFELNSKAQLLDEANAIIKKQEVELKELQDIIEGKGEALEVAEKSQKLEEEKLQVAKAKLEKQARNWLLVRKELHNLTEVASKHVGEGNETMEDFKRVKMLLSDVRSELVSSQKALASSRKKMEEQEEILQKQLIEHQEQKDSIISHIANLRDAQIKVGSDKIQLRVEKARNNELERDLSLEMELIKQLQEELFKERSSLEEAIAEKNVLRDELDRAHARYLETLELLEFRESELVEARLEIQQLKSEISSTKLILAEKDAEIVNTEKKLEEVNGDVTELRFLLDSKEYQLMVAADMVKEKDEKFKVIQHELDRTELKFSEAKTVVRRISELTNRLISEDSEKGNLNDELEALRGKEEEIVAIERVLTMRAEELRLIRAKEENAADVKRIYGLMQERNVVEAATSALYKLADMSKELLSLSRLCIEVDSDNVVVPEKADGFGELKMEIERLSDMSDRLVKEAGIVVD